MEIRVPFHPHELLGEITFEIIKELQEIIQEKATPFVCVNILYHVPRWKGTLHFFPYNVNKYIHKVYSPDSSYFEELKKLKYEQFLPMPNGSDIDALVDFALKSKRVTSALFELIDRGVHKILEESDKYRINNPKCLLKNLLKIFVDLKEEKIKTLRDKRESEFLLIIYTLLSFIPQFECARGKLLGSENSSFEKEKKRKIKWVGSAEKIKEWRDAIRNKQIDSIDPGTRLFFLLSTIESLQWDKNFEFGLISA